MVLVDVATEYYNLYDSIFSEHKKQYIMSTFIVKLGGKKIAHRFYIFQGLTGIMLKDYIRKFYPNE